MSYFGVFTSLAPINTIGLGLIPNVSITVTLITRLPLKFWEIGILATAVPCIALVGSDYGLARNF